MLHSFYLTYSSLSSLVRYQKALNKTGKTILFYIQLNNSFLFAKSNRNKGSELIMFTSLLYLPILPFKYRLSRPLLVYFRPFHITIQIWIEKNIDIAHGIQTLGLRMVGADVSTDRQSQSIFLSLSSFISSILVLSLSLSPSLLIPLYLLSIIWVTTRAQCFLLLNLFALGFALQKQSQCSVQLAPSWSTHSLSVPVHWQIKPLINLKLIFLLPTCLRIPKLNSKIPNCCTKMINKLNGYLPIYQLRQ